MTAALLGAVCASPFLFGCVEPWSRGLLELAIFALTAVQLARAPFAWRRVPPHAWGIFAVAGLAAVQARAPLSALAAAGGPATSSAWASAATARLWAAYGCLAGLAAVALVQASLPHKGPTPAPRQMSGIIPLVYEQAKESVTVDEEYVKRLVKLITKE